VLHFSENKSVYAVGDIQPCQAGKWLNVPARQGGSVWAYMLDGYGPYDYDCFDRATIRHNLTEFKLRWLDRIKQWDLTPVR